METMGLAAVRNPNPAFWRKKRVLLTGHTGFKGGWLALWLQRMGAEITGIGLPPNTQPNLFQLADLSGLNASHLTDLRNADTIARIVRESAPEIVFHLAAQPLVRASYQDPLGTLSTNIQGTANLLEALRWVDSVQVVVAITTDKVYRNREQVYPYRENDNLGGHDPYSASKAAAEIVIASYRDAFLSPKGIAVASARAGNVIGGGDWSDDRLIPDAVRAWSRGDRLRVRNPEARRPWQHVLEPLSGYLILAEQLWDQPALSDAYNFGPYTHEATTVRQVVELASASYGAGEVDWGGQREGPHEARWLSLEIAKAQQCLGVRPRWNLINSVNRTLQWYRMQQKGEHATRLCGQDIEAFEAAEGCQ